MTVIKVLITLLTRSHDPQSRAYALHPHEPAIKSLELLKDQDQEGNYG